MSAPVQPKRPDPWLDLAPVTIVEMLTVREWPVRVSAEGVSLALSSDGFAIVITAGREGEAAWKALRAAHPEGKVRGPRWREEDCALYVVRQPVDASPIHTCDLVPGVRVLASGSVPIPPSVGDGVQKRWSPDAHAATVEAAALPAWVSVIAHDPDARRAAELVAERAAHAETHPDDARDQAMRATEQTSRATDARPRIVVSSRTTSRDSTGAVAGALIVRSTVPDLARAGLDALSGTPWGERVFTIEGSNPPTMVHVLPPGVADDGSPDSAPRARIVPTSRHILRGWLSGAARWVTEGIGRTGREVHEADPPEAVVAFALEACEAMRPLRGVVEAPVMRADGSVIDQPGYDPATRLYASFDVEAAREALDAIPSHPTVDDARRSAESILTLVCDFPFESEAHRSMWLAGLVTMLAREVFHGPAPLFFARANTQGSGKSLLAEVAHIIVTGERPAMLGWSGNDEEFEKLVTAEAIAGSSCVVIDNVTGTMRSACLDRILTSGKHRARILGGSTRFDGAMRAVWWASGNNVETSADMGRRIGPIELVAQEERPDQREGFAADEANGETGSAALRAKAKRERWRHVAAVITILRAWHCAGRPTKGSEGKDGSGVKALTPWGSFESWSRVVRGALVHAGCVDPADAREEFRDSAATESGQLRGLLAGWHEAVKARVLSPDGETLARVVKKLLGRDPAERGGDELREALESIAGDDLARWRGEHMRAAGKFLRANRRKVARTQSITLMLETAGESGGSARWRVAESEVVRGSRGSRGCLPPAIMTRTQAPAQARGRAQVLSVPGDEGALTPYTPFTPSYDPEWVEDPPGFGSDLDSDTDSDRSDRV